MTKKEKIYYILNEFLCSTPSTLNIISSLPRSIFRIDPYKNYTEDISAEEICEIVAYLNKEFPASFLVLSLPTLPISLIQASTPELREIVISSSNTDLEMLRDKFKDEKQTINLHPDIYKLPTYEEIMNGANELQKELRERGVQKKLRKEQFKQQRILNSKEDKKVHALNTIIEHIEPYYPEQKNSSIDYYYFNYEDQMVDSKLLERFLEEAQQEKCFKKFKRTNYADGTRFVFINIDLEKLKAYKIKLEKKLVTKRAQKITTTINLKHVRLDKKDYLLEINKGEKFISFKSKKQGEGTESETKIFKILCHLWDVAHWEEKNGKTKGANDMMEPATLENLTKNSGCLNNNATSKQIQRINERFEKEGVKIEIIGQNKKYRLVVHKF